MLDSDISDIFQANRSALSQITIYVTNGVKTIKIYLILFYNKNVLKFTNSRAEIMNPKTDIATRVVANVQR